MLQRSLRVRPPPPGLTVPPSGQTAGSTHPSGDPPKSSPDGRGEPYAELRKLTDGELEPLTYSAKACQALEASSHWL